MRGVGEAVAVVATIERERLPAALSAIHRGGFGHVTRVIDARRGDPAGQLRRAGADVPAGFGLNPETHVAVYVPAPGRAERAAALLEAYGADRIELLGRSTLVPAVAPATEPDVRLPQLAD